MLGRGPLTYYYSGGSKSEDKSMKQAETEAPPAAGSATAVAAE